MVILNHHPHTLHCSSVCEIQYSNYQLLHIHCIQIHVVHVQCHIHKDYDIIHTLVEVADVDLSVLGVWFCTVLVLQ